MWPLWAGGRCTRTSSTPCTTLFRRRASAACTTTSYLAASSLCPSSVYHSYATRPARGSSLKVRRTREREREIDDVDDEVNGTARSRKWDFLESKTSCTKTSPESCKIHDTMHIPEPRHVGGCHGREVGDLYHSHVLHAERPARHVLHHQEGGRR
jgi:hypothetical protein